MKKLVSTLIFLSFLTNGGVALAQSAGSGTASSAEVTIQDLGIENPGILPTNPFYFFKVWQRSFQRRIIRDPLKRAAYELDVVNQQAAEIKQLETYSQDTDAIRGAVLNYQDNLGQLKARLEDLKETSSNPDVDKMLQQLAGLSLKHQSLLSDIEAKFSDNIDLQNSIEGARGVVGEVLAEIPRHFESTDKFENRILRIMSEQGTFSHAENAIEVLGRIESKLPAEAQQRISDVRIRLEQRLQKSIEENMLKTLPAEGVPSTSTKPEEGKSEAKPPVFKLLPIKAPEEIKTPDKDSAKGAGEQKGLPNVF